MLLKGQGTVFKGIQGTQYQSAAFPGVGVLPGGKWLVSFRTAPTKQSTVFERTLLSWSDDCGKTWSKPIEPFPGYYNIQGKNGVIRGMYITPLGGSHVMAGLIWIDASNTSRPNYNPETSGVLDYHIMTSFSEDSGETWSVPVYIDIPEYREVMCLDSAAVETPSGSMVLPFEVHNSFYYGGPSKFQVRVLISHNSGKSFDDHFAVYVDPTHTVFCWDSRLAVLSDGTLIMAYWTYDDSSAQYLNIHCNESKDGGKTWSKIWDTGVPGQPAPMIEIEPGIMALVYVDRTREPKICVRTSNDGGHTFSPDTELCAYTLPNKKQEGNKSNMADMWFEMFKFSVGLPQTAKITGGDILAVFYAGEDSECTDIRWVRIGK